VAEQHRYLLLNKPRGYVTTRSDPQKRPTVIDLLRGVREYVYPVGRLDFDSEGLLLLTNDGDLAARLTHPRHGVARVYEARVLGVPDAHDLDRLARGLVIDGQRTDPAEVKVRSRPSLKRVGPHPHAHQDRALVAALSPSRSEREGETLLEITVREGRNRQVRKMCDAIGHPVTHLKRVAIGPLRDGRLKLGHWRELAPQEVRRLRAATDAPARENEKHHQGDHRNEPTTKHSNHKIVIHKIVI
jgi:23S rRNA pseudouridine2605 synthase